MKKLILSVLLFSVVAELQGQYSLHGVVKDASGKESLAGASIMLDALNKGTTSNKNGFFIYNNIPGGWYLISISFTGYAKKTDSIYLPQSLSDTLIFLLQPENDELDEVIVQSTRTSRTIQNTPTRIETIEREEIDEKTNMRPSNVFHVIA